MKFHIDQFGDKICSTSQDFCLALLHEVLCKLAPSHELWHKLKYATFLLSIADRYANFELLYNIFHQVIKEGRLAGEGVEDGVGLQRFFLYG